MYKKKNITATVFFYIVTIFLVLTLSSKESNAKTFAYLIGTDGTVLKIDTDTDSIISSSQLEKSSYVQSGQTSIVADRTNNHLFVVDGRFESSIDVYDLKTLKFVKNMGIASNNPDVGILVSPNGKQLFISWFDPEKKGWFFDLFDAKNLSEIRNLGEFVWGPETTFSPDGSKIYVYHNDKIKKYETTNFTLLETIDLNTIWRTDGFSPAVRDYKDEKILISEIKEVAQNSPPEITYFVYDLGNMSPSSRISTSIGGNAKLSLNGTKIFINREEPFWNKDKNYVKYQKSMGDFHVYSVATASALGVVQFTVDRNSKIIGMHPNGNKVYLTGDISNVKSLLVMDVVNFKVIKTIKIPDTILFMVFFEK